MARLKALEPHEFPPEMKEMVGDAISDKRQLGVTRIWAQRPELALAYKRLISDILKASILPRRLIELVRLRVAFHNQCRNCMAVRYSAAVEDGVSEELICELAEPETAPNLTERERAAIRYADLVASNHLAVNDATFDDLRLHFTEPEIIEMGAHIAYCLGFGRVASTWDMVDDLPERFHDRTEKVTPWGGDAVLKPDRAPIAAEATSARPGKVG